MEKGTDILQELEEEELESPNEEMYKKLFVYYLLQDKLVDAKLLWSRLPPNLRLQAEIRRLETLRQTLTTENTAEFFKNIEFEWSPSIAPLLKELLEKIRRGIFQLVGSAYTTIFERNLRQMTNMSSEELRLVCKELDWSYETVEEGAVGEDGQVAMDVVATGDDLIIIPKPPPCEQEPFISSESQLEELTEFVSFLEN